MAEPPGILLDGQSVLSTDYQFQRGVDDVYSSDDDDENEQQNEYHNNPNNNDYHSQYPDYANTMNRNIHHHHHHAEANISEEPSYASVDYKEQAQSFVPDEEDEEEEEESNYKNNNNNDYLQSDYSSSRDPNDRILSPMKPKSTPTQNNDNNSYNNTSIDEDATLVREQRASSILQLPIVPVEESTSYIVKKDDKKVKKMIAPSSEQSRRSVTETEEETFTGTNHESESYDIIKEVTSAENNDRAQFPIANSYRKTSNNELSGEMPVAPLISMEPVSVIMTARSALPNDETIQDEVQELMTLTENFNADLPVEQLSALKAQGFPVGLALEVGASVAAYPLRFWIVDNSGSMRTNDGHQVRFGNKEKDRTVIAPCSRWTELQGTVTDHAKMAALLQVSTTFRFLNDPGAHVGHQEFSVATNKKNYPRSNGESRSEARDRCIQAEASTAVSSVRKTEPSGGTPISQHLREYRQRIEVQQSRLRANGQKAVIVICTDGLPTDDNGDETPAAQKELVQLLKSLQRLPVWVVIRLCTDDRKVVKFYSDIDKKLELNVDVVDDFLGESREIFSANPWLNYALPLHRCREMGYNHRIFDLLDERPLNKDELREFLVVLFGRKAMLHAPDIHTEWTAFVGFLNQINKAEGKHWKTQTRKKEHWIDMKRLNKTFGTGGGWKFLARKIKSARFEKKALQVEI